MINAQKTSRDDAFVLSFGYSNLFRISDFDFRIYNFFNLGLLCAFARVIFLRFLIRLFMSDRFVLYLWPGGSDVKRPQRHFILAC